MVKWTEKKRLGCSLRYIKFSKGLSRMFVSLAKSGFTWKLTDSVTGRFDFTI